MTSQSKTSPTKKPEAKTPQPTYEDKAVHLARHAIEQICQQVPELRSAVIVFDWRDRLNDVSVPAAFWTCNGEPVATDADYVASLLNQFGRVIRMVTSLAIQCITGCDKLIKDGREQLIHESKLTAAEKAALLARIGRERAGPGGSEQEESAG